MALETENNEAAEGVYADETRVYELGFHLDAELGQEEVKKQYQTIRDHITASGTIVAEGEPTKIPLAYTISRQETTGRRDFDTAYFCWIAYETDGAAHEELLSFVQDITSIIRFIDIRTDRETAHHAAEMHELFIRNAAEAAAESDEEDASETDTSTSAADATEPRKETEV